MEKMQIENFLKFKDLSGIFETYKNYFFVISLVNIEGGYGPKTAILTSDSGNLPIRCTVGIRMPIVTIISVAQIHYFSFEC